MSEFKRERVCPSGNCLGGMKQGQRSRLAFMAVTVEGYLSRELAGRGMKELLHRLPDDHSEVFAREPLVKTAMESLRRY